jgi:hypothetical protein
MDSMNIDRSDKSWSFSLGLLPLAIVSTLTTVPVWIDNPAVQVLRAR